MSKNDLLLAGDIGGTKTRLAIFSAEVGPRNPLVESTFPSGEFTSFEAMVQAFLKDQSIVVSRASFGVAGPVIGERAQVTNLTWAVDSRALRQTLGVPILLLNDLEAIAHGVPSLKPEDLVTLKPGQPVEHGPIAIIAPGTGLGEAFMLWDGVGYRPYPSEGGHADFAPSTSMELDLLRYLMLRGEHVSYERVCSGLGMPNLYAFLKQTGRFEEPDWLHLQLANALDPTPVIVDAAVANRAKICVQTLSLFISILAAEAGNLALKILASGGVYIAGGIPPRILSQLQGKTFLEAFSRKGRFSDFLSRVPVYVVRTPEVALLGVACHAFESAADASS